MICLAPVFPGLRSKRGMAVFLTHRALASAEPAKSSVTDSQTDVISMLVLRKHAAKARPGSRLSPRAQNAVVEARRSRAGHHLVSRRDEEPQESGHTPSFRP